MKKICAQTIIFILVFTYLVPDAGAKIIRVESEGTPSTQSEPQKTTVMDGEQSREIHSITIDSESENKEVTDREEALSAEDGKLIDDAKDLNKVDEIYKEKVIEGPYAIKNTTSNPYGPSIDPQFGDAVPDTSLENNLPGQTSGKQSYINTYSGAASYAYPIALPPGRNNMTPSFALSYSSDDKSLETTLGRGWSLGSMQYVSRSTKYGTDNVFDDSNRDAFTVLFSGGSCELLPMDEGVYGEYQCEVITGTTQKIEFLSANTWRITDSYGTQYTFGTDLAHTQYDSGNTSNIYKWMLYEVRDTNDNYITYDYFYDSGQIYPKEIRYTGHGANQASNDGIFSIRFQPFYSNSGLNVRDDVIPQYDKGFEIETRYRIEKIEIFVGDEIRSQYELSYDYGEYNMFSVLEQISYTGYDIDGNADSSLPPTTFTYETSRQDNEFDYDSSWNDSSNTEFTDENGQDQGVRIADFNNDGLPDLIKSLENGPSFGNNMVFINTGSDFDAQDWGTLLDIAEVTDNNNIVVDRGTRVVDLDGDGFMDLIQGDLFGRGWDDPRKKVYLNIDGNFTSNSLWQASSFIAFSDGNSDLSSRFHDVNGDGLVDIIHSHDDYGPTRAIFINEGNAFYFPQGSAPYGTDYYFPRIIDDQGRDEGVRIVDINNDQLPDIVKSERGVGEAYYINTGHHFESDSAYDNANVPYFTSYADSDIGGRAIDVNNDGLTDFIGAYTYLSDGDEEDIFRVHINKGNGVIRQESSWRDSGPTFVEELIEDTDIYVDKGVRIMDVNGDSLPDLVEGRDNTDRVYLNKGDHFDRVNDWTNFPTFIDEFGRDQGVRYIDLDGDGLIDIYQSCEESDKKRGIQNCLDSKYRGSDVNRAYINATNYPDLLIGIDTGAGLEVSIEYDASMIAKPKAGGFTTKYPKITVKKVTISDTIANVETDVSYEFNDGFYDFNTHTDQAFRGFHEVIVTEEDLSVSKQFFHQGGNVDGSTQGEYDDHFAKAGLPYRTELYDDNGNLYETVINKVEIDEFNGDDDFEGYVVKTTRSTSFSYDGDNDFKATGTEKEYDQYGNTTLVTEYGEVQASTSTGEFTDIQDDKIITSIDYIYHKTDGYIVSNPSQIELDGFDPDIQVLTERAPSPGGDGEIRYFYDNLPFGEISKGNVTKIIQENEGGPFKYDEAEYNAYGLITKTRNSRGYETDFHYDSGSEYVYPSSIENALGHTTEFTYDFALGSVIETIDTNNAKHTYAYDPYGRLVEVKITDPDNTSTQLTSTEFSYDYSSSPIKITQTLYAYENDVTPYTINYLDGRGNVMQARTLSNEDDTFTVNNTVYDEYGRIEKTITPFYEQGEDFTSIVTQDPGVSFEYDILGRVVSMSDTIGTITHNYDQWKETVLDQKNNIKEYFHDARGNLVTVKEYNDSQVYITNYTYNMRNDVVKIEDSLGNEKVMEYDWFHHLLAEEHLHTPNDSPTTSQVIEYEYDDNGNLVVFEDSRGKKVEYDYDALDRLKKIDYKGSGGGVFARLYYDEGGYQKGRLSRVVSDNAEKQFMYDVHGRISVEHITIDDTQHEIYYDHDLLGNIIFIQYPVNSGKVNYSYGNDNALHAIDILKGVRAGVEPLITDITYGPHGGIEEIQYANGVTTTNTYPRADMYRLQNKHTVSGDTVLQDYTYSYDKVSNITQILDRSDVNTYKTAVFDYDDLYRLTSATITDTTAGQNYTRTYQYDPVGNMTYNSAVGSYTYAGNDSSTSTTTNAHPHAVTSIGSTQYEYDDSGNLISDGEWNYAWDHDSRLIEAVRADGTINLEYLYDEGGNRVKSINNTSDDYTVYINNLVDISGDDKKAYIYAGNQKVATEYFYESFSCTTDDWQSSVTAQCTPEGTETITWTKTNDSCVGGVSHPPTQERPCTWTPPMCTDNDWESVDTPAMCPHTGDQTRTWTKTGQCEGGATHPSSEPVSCTPEIFDSCVAIKHQHNDAESDFYSIQPPTSSEPYEVYCDMDSPDGPFTLSAKDIQSGLDFSCALLEDGTLKCWGRNTYGQLGNGTTTHSSTPVSVQNLQYVKSMDLGNYHACAIDENDLAWCWGRNDKGQLGDNSTINKHTPIQVQDVSNVTSISTGKDQTCAVKEDGSAWCWGSNAYGKLGDGSGYDQYMPVAVSGINVGNPAVEIDTKNNFSCARMTSGEIECWGENSFGQLGDGTNQYKIIPVTVAIIDDATDISLGSNHVCAVHDNVMKNVSCWGRNDGRLGLWYESDHMYFPRTVLKAHDVLSIESSYDHTCTIHGDGSMKCWGRNEYGQIGTGSASTEYVDTPTTIVPSDINDTAPGVYHTCMLTDTKKVMCWGKNNFGQLGLGHNNNTLDPEEVWDLRTGPPLCTDDDWTHVDEPDYCPLSGEQTRTWTQINPLCQGGVTHLPTEVVTCEPDVFASCSAVLQSDPSAPDDFYLIQPTVDDDPFQAFCDMTSPDGPWMHYVKEMALGYNHSCALFEDGHVRCMGANSTGQLGVGNNYSYYDTPQKVVNLGGKVVDISAGENYTCAVLDTGGAQCWGYNWSSQLGNGTHVNSNVPIDVLNLSNAVSITAGENHTCVLLDTDEVACWGANHQGQAGVPGDNKYETPVIIPNFNNITKIEVGERHSCAINVDNDLFCWGQNNYGQLGNNTTTQINVPTENSYIENVSDIDLGWTHTCATKLDGTAWCWGQGQGRLGDGTTAAQRIVPTQVVNLSNAQNISVGRYHACARTSDGALHCWGQNHAGQVGNGTNSIAYSPVEILDVDVSSVAGMHGDHTCVIMNDKSVKCWGRGSSGQLGMDNNWNYDEPVDVLSLKMPPDGWPTRIIDNSDDRWKKWEKWWEQKLGNRGENSNNADLKVSYSASSHEKRDETRGTEESDWHTTDPYQHESAQSFHIPDTADVTIYPYLEDNTYGPLPPDHFVGDLVTVGAFYHNGGPDHANNMIASLDYDETKLRVVYLDANNCKDEDGVIYCQIGDMGLLRGIYRFNFQAEIIDDGIITLDAEVYSDLYDPNSRNNTGSMYFEAHHRVEKLMDLPDQSQVSLENYSFDASPYFAHATGYTISGASFLSIDENGIMSGTMPDVTEEQTYTVTLGAGNAKGAVYDTFTFTVYPVLAGNGVHLFYHHPDHLGSSGVDTDESGAVANVFDYFPYGSTRIAEQTGPFENDYTYNGKEEDADTGLHYYGARYYNADIGRFLSIDPWSGDLSDPQSLNKYAYVRNNPMNYVDPTGKSWKYWAAAAYEFTDSMSWDLLPDLEYEGYSQEVIDGGRAGNSAAVAVQSAEIIAGTAGVKYTPPTATAVCTSSGYVLCPAAGIGALYAETGSLLMLFHSSSSLPSSINKQTKLRNLESIQNKSERTNKLINRIAERIKKIGYEKMGLDPIDVYSYNGATYIIDGHHRWKAANKAGLKFIPTRNLSAQEAAKKLNTTVDDLGEQLIRWSSEANF